MKWKGIIIMDVNKFCADTLKKLREQRNLTQTELAEELGITQQQVARYENNLRQFKQDFLFKLAESFKVSINLSLALLVKTKPFDFSNLLTIPFWNIGTVNTTAREDIESLNQIS